MNLKITTKTAAEAAIQLPKTTSLKLCGIDKLNTINPDLAVLFDESNLFVNVFGLDTKLFYVAEKVSSENKFVLRERGIGYVSSTDDGYLFNRLTPISVQYSDGSISPCNGSPVDLYVNPGEHVVISSSYPASHIELLHDSHCVITSREPFVPSPVVIQDNSLLGRFKEDIVSIAFSDFASVAELQNALIDSLSKYSKQINLSCSKLSLDNANAPISSSLFQLNPTSSPPAKRGTIMYDENDNNIKYYDGSSWRTLATK